MAFIAILVAVIAQRFLNLRSSPYQLNWTGPYFQWMRDKFAPITEGRGLVSLLILVVPLLLIVSLIFAITFNLFSWIGYFVLSTVFVWNCIDYSDLYKTTDPQTNVRKLFMDTYQNLFAVIFWFFVFGPVGLALYHFIVKLRDYLNTTTIEKTSELLMFTEKTQAILDWIPLRLLAMSFALVGHFGAVFKTLHKDLLTGIRLDHEQAADWGLAALEANVVEETGPSSSECVELRASSIALINRALILWLVVIGLLSIIYWA